MTKEMQMQALIETLKEIINIPSPTGFTEDVLAVLAKKAADLGYEAERIQKGGLVVSVPGKSAAVLGLSAHVDTLGAMVRSATDKGYLKFSSVGGYMMQTIEGEYCRIHCRQNGRVYTGTVLTTMPSVHVYDQCRTQERSEGNMEIRIDENVSSAEDVAALGIGAGDFISFEPRFEHTASGYVKCRHLDDKAGVAMLMTVLKYMKETNQQPEKTLKILFSNYEEIGHGSSYIPQDIEEFLAIDMGAVGEDLTGDEKKVSICAMDASGPYDYEMTNRLIEIAREKGLSYAVDIFPHYGSDVSAALRGGNNICGALIGQGVHASHSMERSHEEGFWNTMELIKGFIGVK